MIEVKAAAQHMYQAEQSQAARHKVLKMVKAERMGGSVPVWETAQSPAQKVQENLGRAVSGPGEGQSFENALALQSETQVIAPNEPSAEFGFGDLVDMINPLQHVPLVGKAYRAVTGDDIKPISKLVGGSLFGGPIGGAVAMVNMIAEGETGKDVTGTAWAALTGNDFAAKSGHFAGNQSPEERLSDIVALLEYPGSPAQALNGYEDLPGSTLAFADLGAPRPVPAAVTTPDTIPLAATKPLHLTRRYND